MSSNFPTKDLTWRTPRYFSLRVLFLLSSIRRVGLIFRALYMPGRAVLYTVLILSATDFFSTCDHISILQLRISLTTARLLLVLVSIYLLRIVHMHTKSSIFNFISKMVHRYILLGVWIPNSYPPWTVKSILIGSHNSSSDLDLFHVLVYW